MKVSFVLIIFLFFSLSAKAQKDTVFISKTVEENYYRAIFIEEDYSSEHYSRLIDFTFDEYDTATYDNSIEFINSFKNFDFQDLPRTWCPLYIYQDKFYLYKPSDWGYHKKIMMTDSTVMIFYMEGPFGLEIRTFKKVSGQEFEFSIGSGRENTSLNIQIIDTVNQVAIFKESFFKTEPQYYFMVSAEKAKNFPIIVNYCQTDRQPEFEFETPDFKKYLSK